MLTPAVRSEAVRSESPVGVPTVIAENVEITTEAVASPVPPSSSASEYHQRQEGGKRSAAKLLESDLGPSTKNPRLSPEVLGESPQGC